MLFARIDLHHLCAFPASPVCQHDPYPAAVCFLICLHIHRIKRNIRIGQAMTKRESRLHAKSIIITVAHENILEIIRLSFYRLILSFRSKSLCRCILKPHGECGNQPAGRLCNSEQYIGKTMSSLHTAVRDMHDRCGFVCPCSKFHRRTALQHDYRIGADL